MEDINSDDDFVETAKIKNDNVYKIRMLENQLATLERFIEKFNESEMSIEEMDSDFSVYLKQDQIIKKYLELYKQYKKMLNAKNNSQRKYKVYKITRSRFPQINKNISEKLAQKRKRPNYDDIREEIIKTNLECNLGLSAARIDEESCDVYSEVCAQLQNQRRKTFQKNIQLLMRAQNINSLENDPAVDDDNLQSKIEEISKAQKEEFDSIIKNFNIKYIEMPEENK